MKVGEEIMWDDPNPNRHNYTAYLCAACANRVLFPSNVSPPAVVGSAPELDIERLTELLDEHAQWLHDCAQSNTVIRPTHLTLSDERHIRALSAALPTFAGLQQRLADAERDLGFARVDRASTKASLDSYIDELERERADTNKQLAAAERRIGDLQRENEALRKELGR